MTLAVQKNDHWIVVDDPKKEYWEGAVVSYEVAQQLKARNVAILPIIPDLFRSAGIGGFHKRSWGSGWHLNTTIPRVASPMTMFVSKEFQYVHWCALLVPDVSVLERIEEKENFNGFLQLCGDPSQVLANKLTLTTEQSFQARDVIVKSNFHDGGFLIGGRAKTMLSQDGVYGFGLYGMMPGIRVAWSAVSQAQI